MLSGPSNGSRHLQHLGFALHVEHARGELHADMRLFRRLHQRLAPRVQPADLGLHLLARVCQELVLAQLERLV